MLSTLALLRRRIVQRTLILAFGLLCIVGLTGVAEAHGNLLRANPSPNSILASAPSRIDLWFSEELDETQSAIEVYSTDQQRVDQGDSRIDPADETHLLVSLGELPDGTYTVAWRSASSDDGHVIRGTFNLQIGQGRLAAGAATVDGQSPSASATVLRWGTIVGLSLICGWFLLGLLAGELAPSGARIAFFGAVLALFSDLLAVPNIMWGNGTGARVPGLGAALALMPGGWYLRVALELLLTLLVVAGVRWTSRDWIQEGLVIGAVAVASLTFASHAAAESDRTIAIALNTVHLESVTFWLGGLAYLAFVYRRQPQILRRFSRLAVPLFAVALASGIASAGLIIPTPSDLWRSAYGQTLLLKTAVVVLVLGTAWFNRRALARGAFRLLARVQSLRLELALGASVVLIAAVLALSATPAPGRSAGLHLRTSVSDTRFAHLSVDRADVGQRDYTVWLTDANNAPLSDVVGVAANFSMLEQTVDLTSINGTPASGGRWVLRDVPLTIKGWWQANLDFRDRTGAVSHAQFALLLPDPTLVGYRASGADQPEAKALFDRTFQNLLSLRSTRMSEVLGDGIGNSVSTEYEWQAPDRLSYVTSSGNASIAVGSTQFFRDGGGDWKSRQRVSPVNFPLAFRDYYSGADQIRLGRQVTVDGVAYQLLTFHVPVAPRRDQSWYAWWIDAGTGMVWRETMAAQYHYMDNSFHDVNAPIEITAPNGVASR